MPGNRRREGERPPETPDAETDEEVRVSRRAIEEMQAENERLKEYLQRSMQGGMQAYDNDAVNRSVMMQYAGPTAQGPGLLSEDQRRGYAGLWYALLAGSEGDDDEDNPLYILMSKADAPGDLIANIIRLKMKSTWARRAFSLPRERKTIFDVVIKSVLAGSIGKDRMGRSEFVDIMVQNRMPVEKSEKTQQRGGFWSRIASGR